SARSAGRSEKMVNLFASDAGPHISIAPEALFHIGPLTITNSFLLGIIGSLLVLWMLWFAARGVVRGSRNRFVHFMYWIFESVRSAGRSEKMVNLFASDAGPHISIAPEALFHIGPLTITNSFLLGIIGSLLVLWMLWFAARGVVRGSRNRFVHFMYWIFESL